MTATDGPRYEIESHADGRDDWSTDYLGTDAGPVSTVEEAVAVIHSLQALGGEWATAEYRIVRVELRQARRGDTPSVPQYHRTPEAYIGPEEVVE